MKWSIRIFSFLGLLSLLTSCIGDDYLFDTVEPVLQITSMVDTIGLNESYQFEVQYLNNVGKPEDVGVSWISSAPEFVAIDETGLASALMPGSATISVTYEDATGRLEDAIEVIVGDNTVTSSVQKSGIIMTTSSYLLTGDFTIDETQNGIHISIAENYQASSSLPGLYLYLTNNRNSVANAYEVGPVDVFSGAHNYTIENVGINDYGFLLYYCKPFSVKVGDGEIE